MASSGIENLQTRAPACPKGFHPLDWAEVADPYPKLKELRAKCPVATVHREPMPPFKLFTKFEDISRIYRDWESFGNMGVSVNSAEHIATPPEQRQIIASDPPRHGAMRRFALEALSPAQIDLCVPSIATFAKDETAKLPAGEEVELMLAWAAPIPSVATARALGLPDQDALSFRTWVRMGIEALARTMSPSSPDFNWVEAISSGYSGSMFPASADFVGNWVRVRRADPNPPSDDVLSRLLGYVDSETGIRFTDAEAVDQLVTIIAAGNDTTAGLIGNFVYRLATVPGLFDRLKSDRSKLVLAIEESLRLDPPQVMFPRICLKDAVVGDVEVKAGEVIIVSMASGNRDEEVYGDDADEFSLDRKYPNPRHLPMGRGIHTCTGAYLARKVTKVAIDALLDRFSTIRLADGYEYEKVLFHHFRAPERLAVVLEI